MIAKKVLNIVLWLHFILFVVQQMNLSESIFTLAKLSIGGIYFLYLFFLIILLKVKFSLQDLVIISIVFCMVVLKVLFIKTFNVAIVYWLLVYLALMKSGVDILFIKRVVNQIAVVYIVLALILTMTSLRSYFNYEIRELDNRFLFGLNRFIGLEGSPAGPDIFYSLVILVNIYCYPTIKTLLKPVCIMSLVIVFWTASLTAVMALIGSYIVYHLYRFRSIFFIIGILVPFIVHKIYNYNNYEFKYVLDTLTTLRSHIWFQVLNSLNMFNTLEEWLFGREVLMNFYNVGELDVINGNPHNLILWLMEFLGVPLLILVVLFSLRFYLGLEKGITMYMVTFILIYSISNGIPFTTHGNPIVLYILIFFLFVETKKNNLLYK